MNKVYDWIFTGVLFIPSDATEDEAEPIRPVVRILDTQTGEIRECPNDLCDYWWRDGNGSCDCNREIWFKLANDELEVYGDGCGYCDGCVRFLIVDEDGKPLEDFNDDYPEDLLSKYRRATT